MSVSEGVTGAEIKGRAAPRALGVRGGVKEGEEFELRREVKCQIQGTTASGWEQRPAAAWHASGVGKCWLGCPPHPTSGLLGVFAWHLSRTQLSGWPAGL